MILAAILGGTNLAKEMATSNNPWAYLVGLLLLGIAIVARLVWLDMKKGRERLEDLDKQHREESLKREERLNEQLEKSIEANAGFVDTQKEMITALNGVQSNLHSLKTTFGKRIDHLEQIVEKEKEGA
ncbi:hypothetical protein [Lysinibacillus sphaericus]|uniref:hypothetical protein n=1 Tax=Lysinibacillus sphaericus TaxID=1421 RepID=UPI000563831D|nr:hypothetical protein [Lysinibacillus sphaericus]